MSFFISEETRGEVVPPVYKLGDFGLMINYEKDAMSDAQEGDSRFKLTCKTE